MRITVFVLGTMLASTAHAGPIKLLCRQDIEQTSYAGNGKAIPAQHITGTVEYILDPDEPSVMVRSASGTAKFTNGGGANGRHIIVDHDGMTMAGTSTMPNGGPETSEITRFSHGWTYGADTREMRLHGRLLQHSKTVMTCTRSD